MKTVNDSAEKAKMGEEKIGRNKELENLPLLTIKEFVLVIEGCL